MKATGKPKEVMTVVGEKFEEKLKKIDFSEVHLTVNEDDIFMFTSEKRNGSIKKIKELLDSEIDNSRKSFRHNIPSECSFLLFNSFQQKQSCELLTTEAGSFQDTSVSSKKSDSQMLSLFF